MSDIRRREFVMLLGGAAAWPLRARAQQSRTMRRIGVLMNLAADDPEAPVRLAALLQGLQQLGWTVGQNVQIDYRWGAGNADLMRKHAAELAALAPDVILAHSSAAVAPLLEATRTVPIVFAVVADPVGAGYVETWRAQAVTPPALPTLNTLSLRSGSSCSKTSRPM
jgi:putative tryptophan/tyrosine transport system substrate-binding protein